MTVIRVINPNSNQHVTDGLAHSLKPFAIPGRIDILCETLETGPFGIETLRDAQAVVLPLLARMKARAADAFVIACYSDPGLALCRDELDVPVFGIMESAIVTALTRGNRYGVIALSQTSIERHVSAIRAMALLDRLAAERPADVTVAESAGDGVYRALVDAGKKLRDKDDADVIILGCAGMARHRARLERDLNIPIIEPTQAAVSLATGVLLSASV